MTSTIDAPTQSPELQEHPSPGRRLAVRVADHPGAVGLAFSVVVAMLASRGFLFRPGWIAYSADLSIHSDRRLELENWLTGWNHFVGDDNSPILSAAPLWLLLLSFLGTAAAQKLVMFLILFTATATAFVVGERWARDEHGPSPRSVAIGALCGFCYTINPWVATELVHYYYVWLYALLPVTVLLMGRALRAELFSQAAGNVLLVGVVAVATLTAYGVLFHVILAGTFLAVDVVASRGRRRARLRRSSGLVGVLLVTVVAVGSYSTLPVVLGYRNSFVGGTSWALFTTEAMYVLSPYTPVFLAARGLFRITTAQLVEQSLPRFLIPAAALISLLPPLVVSVRVALRRLDRRDLVLLAILGGSLVVANGTNWPTGRYYAMVAQGPFSFIAFVLFKGPYKLLALIMAAVVLLSVRAVITLLAASRMRTLAFAMAGAMVLWSALLGSPLLTGDLASYLRPVEPPASYVKALRSIASDGDDGGRAVWLPTDITGDQHPAWAPRRRELALHGGTVSPPAAWLSPVPISSRGTSYSPPAAGRIFDQLFTYAVTNRPDVDLARLLGMVGRAHVVLQRDATGQRFGAQAGDLERMLGEHPELSLVARTDELAIFSTGRREAVAREGYRVAVGGHEQLLVSSAAGRVDGRALVFADDVPADREAARRLLDGADGLLFSPGQSWDDLALDTWPEPDHLYDLADHVVWTVPLSTWKKTFFESNEWVGPTGYTGSFAGERFGPGLSGPFVFTEKSATVSFRTRIAVRPADVWVRAYVNPGAGTLEVDVDGTPTGAVTLSQETALGWKWFRLGRDVDIDAGDRISLSIVEPARGPSRISALDQIAVVPTEVVSRRVEELGADVAGVPLGLAAAWESYVPVGRPSVAGDAESRLVRVPRAGAYRVGVSKLGSSGAFEGAAVGGVPLAMTSTEGDWRYSAPVELKADNYVLRLSGVDPRAFVTLEEVLTTEGAGRRRPAIEMQAFLEPFNPGWQVAGGDPATHVRLNGFVNGFLVREPRPVDFGPDEWVHRARRISLVATVLAVVGGIALSRRRGAHSRTGRSAPPRHRRSHRRPSAGGEPDPQAEGGAPCRPGRQWPGIR